MSKRVCQKLFILASILFSLNACQLLESTEYPVVDSGMEIGEESAYWLDNGHILVQPPSQRINQVEHYLPLQVWDIATNQFSPLPHVDATAGDFFTPLCVGEQFIRYIREKKTSNTTAGAGKWEFFVMPYHKQNGKLVFEAPHQEVVKGALGDIDKGSCYRNTEIKLPDWTKQVSPNDITLLKPEHGFLWLVRDNPTATPKALYLVPPDGKQQDVTKNLFDEMHIKPEPNSTYGYMFDKNNLTYFAFKGAYLLSVQGSNNTWWLYPDGRLVNDGDWGDMMPRRNRNDEVIDEKYTFLDWYTPTASYFVSANYFDHDTIDDFGLYAYMGDRNNPIRIVKGRVNSHLKVSPDGCKVALMNDDRPFVKDGERYKLQVVDVCKGAKP